MRTIAYFTHLGDGQESGRLIRMYRNNRGTYTVDVEGYPALSQTVESLEKAEQILRGWWQLSLKDWGATEIEWV